MPQTQRARGGLYIIAAPVVGLVLACKSTNVEIATLTVANETRSHVLLQSLLGS